MSFFHDSLLVFLAVAHKLFQFVKEAFHVRKLAVDLRAGSDEKLEELLRLLPKLMK